MQRLSLRPLGVTCLLIVLLSAAIYLYTQWDLKRFKETLSAVDAAEKSTEGQRSPHEASESRRFKAGEETPRDAEKEKSQTVSSGHVGTLRDASVEGQDLDFLSESFSEESESPGRAEAVVTDAELENLQGLDPEAPYNIAIVKAGFEDYNAHLASDPEYAYQRLEEAFREQYGDYPEVGIVVEMIRTNNNRPLTVDEAITMTEAFYRITPEPVASVLRQRLVALRDLQKLEQELGEPIPVKYNMHFGP